MTFTEIVQVAGAVLFLLLLLSGACLLWEALWEWVEERYGNKGEE